MTMHFGDIQTTPSKEASSFDALDQALLLYVLRDDYIKGSLTEARLRVPESVEDD